MMFVSCFFVLWLRVKEYDIWIFYCSDWQWCWDPLFVKPRFSCCQNACWLWSKWPSLSACLTSGHRIEKGHTWIGPNLFAYQPPDNMLRDFKWADNFDNILINSLSKEPAYIRLRKEWNKLVFSSQFLVSLFKIKNHENGRPVNICNYDSWILWSITP